MPIGNPIQKNNDTRVISATATTGQTDFTVTGGYTLNAIGVFRNGVRLNNSTDFTAADGSTVSLNVACDAGDTVTFHIFDKFTVANAIVGAASTQTISGNLRVTGELYSDDFKPDKIVSLNISQKTDYLTFASRDVFVTAACHIKRGGTLELIGKEVDDFRVKKNLLMPVIDTNTLKGVITYIDNYGNAITNIDLTTFEKHRRSRNFSILFGREDEEIKKISTKYKEVEIAEKLAIFNSNNFLQISINQGSANTLLGLNFFDIIRIEFK